MDYCIRTAGAEDQPIIWEMLYHSLLVPEGGEPLPREILKDEKLSRYAAYWGRSGDRAAIAESRGDGYQPPLALGAAWCRRFSQDAPGYGFISEDIPEIGLAIIPEVRGRGIGTALLKSLIADVQCSRGLNEPATKALSLSVMRFNPVIRLYQREGFRSVSESEIAFVMLLKFV